MNQVDIRKMVLQKLREYLGNCQSLSNFDAAPIEQNFFQKKTFPQKKLSSNARLLLSKIYGTKYRLVYDDPPFQSTNNIRALALAVAQIAFQDPYTTSLLISEMKQNRQYITQIKNSPLQIFCSPELYPTLIDHAIYELCYICEQNIELPIRDILSAYYLGLEMFCLIVRGILCKLKYPEAEDYLSENLRINTIQLFTIICEYLDINLISKKPKTKTCENTPQLYFFPDFDLFVLTPDNKEFVCGKYFQSEELLKSSAPDKRNPYVSEVMGHSFRLDEKCLNAKPYQTSLKNSNQFSILDLRTSQSDDIQPYILANCPTTPSFFIQTTDDAPKFKYSIEKEDALYFPIEEEDEHLEASIQRKGENDFQSYQFRNGDFFKSDSITLQHGPKSNMIFLSGNKKKQQQHLEVTLNLEDFVVHKSQKKLLQEDNYGSDKSEAFSEQRNQDFSLFSPIDELLTLNLDFNKFSGELQNTPLLTARELLKEMLSSSKQNSILENHLKYRGSCNGPSIKPNSNIKKSDILQNDFMKNSDVQGYRIYDNFKESQNASKNIFKTNFSTRQSPNKTRLSYQAFKQCLNKQTARMSFNQILQRNQSKAHLKPALIKFQKKAPIFFGTKTLTEEKQTNLSIQNQLQVPNDSQKMFPLKMKLKKMSGKDFDRKYTYVPKTCINFNQQCMSCPKINPYVQVCHSERKYKQVEIMKKKNRKKQNMKFPEFLRNKKIGENNISKNRSDQQIKKALHLLQDHNVKYKGKIGKLPQFLRTPRQSVSNMKKNEIKLYNQRMRTQIEELSENELSLNLSDSIDPEITETQNTPHLGCQNFIESQVYCVKDNFESQGTSKCQTKRQLYGKQGQNASMLRERKQIFPVKIVNAPFFGGGYQRKTIFSYGTQIMPLSGLNQKMKRNSYTPRIYIKD